MPSESSTGDTDRCDRCEKQRETTTLYRDGRVWAAVCEGCHDDLAKEIAEPDGGEDQERTLQEEWEAHNETFSYKPPEKPGDAWSSEEYQELHDRFISRRTEWFCDKCTGKGPMSSLQKARSHVSKQHGVDLVQKYETPREELEAATDGGTSTSKTEKRKSENRGLNEFSGGDEQ